MSLMPEPSLPRRNPVQGMSSPKDRAQVGEPWKPILFSTPRQNTPFLSAGEPSGPGRNLGTMNRERPFVPAGAPSTLASTMWMMFSVRSCSPAEMKIFCPSIR
jgi:hypothetical protein